VNEESFVPPIGKPDIHYKKPKILIAYGKKHWTGKNQFPDINVQNCHGFKTLRTPLPLKIISFEQHKDITFFVAYVYYFLIRCLSVYHTRMILYTTQPS
jgi:hypothetical protein